MCITLEFVLYIHRYYQGRKEKVLKLYTVTKNCMSGSGHLKTSVNNSILLLYIWRMSTRAQLKFHFFLLLLTAQVKLIIKNKRTLYHPKLYVM